MQFDLPGLAQGGIGGFDIAHGMFIGMFMFPLAGRDG
jgi:hypothetical protein